MSKALDTAIEAAQKAGEVLLAHYGKPLQIEEKSMRGDLVTQADRESEQAIFKHLRARFPHAAFLGEETGATAGSSGERWIVDPLDGTTNFAHDYPIFCISLAYECDGDVTAGVIYAPVMNELFCAERGSGAKCNGRTIRVSAISDVEEALVCTGFQPANYSRNGPFFALASNRTQGVRRDGAAALDLAYVARGRFDGFWEFDLHEWDVAAGSLIVREAGGAVSQIDGTAHTLTSPSVLATNARIHAGLTAMFATLR